MPNVSGGLVISKIEQRTKWDLESNAGYAQTAERYGFEYALTQIRFMAGYGAVGVQEPVDKSKANSLAGKSTRICILLPGIASPYGKTHSDGSFAARAMESGSGCEADC